MRTKRSTRPAGALALITLLVAFGGTSFAAISHEREPSGEVVELAVEDRGRHDDGAR